MTILIFRSTHKEELPKWQSSFHATFTAKHFNLTGDMWREMKISC